MTKKIKSNKKDEIYKSLLNFLILLILFSTLFLITMIIPAVNWSYFSFSEMVLSSLIFILKMVLSLIVLLLFIKIRIKLVRWKDFIKENIIQLIFLSLFYTLFSLYLVRSIWMLIYNFFPSYVIRYDPHLVSLKLYGFVVFYLFFIRLLPYFKYMKVHFALKSFVDEKAKTFLKSIITPVKKFSDKFLDSIQDIMVGITISFIFLVSLAIRLGADYKREFFQDWSKYNIIILLSVIFLEFLFWYLIPKFQNSKAYTKLIKGLKEGNKTELKDEEYKSPREAFPKAYAFLKKYFPFLFKERFWCYVLKGFGVTCFVAFITLIIFAGSIIKSQQDKINISTTIYLHSYNITFTQNETNYGPIKLVKYEDGVVYSFNPQIIPSVKEISNTNQYLNIKESLIPIQISVEITRKNNGYVKEIPLSAFDCFESKHDISLFYYLKGRGYNIKSFCFTIPTPDPNNFSRIYYYKEKYIISEKEGVSNTFFFYENLTSYTKIYSTDSKFIEDVEQVLKTDNNNEYIEIEPSMFFLSDDKTIKSWIRQYWCSRVCN